MRLQPPFTFAKQIWINQLQQAVTNLQGNNLKVANEVFQSFRTKIFLIVKSYHLRFLMKIFLSDQDVHSLHSIYLLLFFFLGNQMSTLIITCSKTTQSLITHSVYQKTGEYVMHHVLGITIKGSIHKNKNQQIFFFFLKRN